MPNRVTASDEPDSAPLPDAAAGADEVQERGAFAYGSCEMCGWQGPGRRSRDRARKDLKHHLESKPKHADHGAVEEAPH